MRSWQDIVYTPAYVGPQMLPSWSLVFCRSLSGVCKWPYFRLYISILYSLQRYRVKRELMYGHFVFRIQKIMRFLAY